MKAVQLCILLLLLLASGCTDSEEIPTEVYDLRQIGVNVLGMEKGFSSILVLYEPVSDEQQMMLDVGIIAGYLYETNKFSELEVQVELSETEIFTVTIDGDDVEKLNNEAIDSSEFRERWIIT